MLTREKYLNPYTDFGFKKLFGTAANKELVIDFLNQLIPEGGIITDLEFLSTEKLGRSQPDRKSVFDIYCKNEKGERFIVEMQKAEQSYFKDRSVYYSTFPIQEQAKSGKWDYELKAVYFVGILDFVFDENKEDKEVFHHEVKLIDRKTNKVFYDKLTYIYLEMPKFNKTEADLKNLFDKWLYVLKFLPKFQERPKILKEHIFNKLFQVAELSKLTPAEARSYEESLKNYRDNINVVDTARKKGLKEGLERGEKRGLAKGKAEGLAEGEAKKTKEMVINCYDAGIDIKTIATITKLTVEQISEIIQK